MEAQLTKTKSKEQLQIEKLQKQAAQEKQRMIKPGECNKVCIQSFFF
jgi:hypothetical protein